MTGVEIRRKDDNVIIMHPISNKSRGMGLSAYFEKNNLDHMGYPPMSTGVKYPYPQRPKVTRVSTGITIKLPYNIMAKIVPNQSAVIGKGLIALEEFIYPLGDAQEISMTILSINGRSFDDKDGIIAELHFMKYDFITLRDCTKS